MRSDMMQAVVSAQHAYLHDHEILINLCCDSAEERGELVLTGCDLAMSVVLSGE